MKCAVITPVGPGHREIYDTQCLPEIRKAILHSTGPFEEVVVIAIDDTEGKYGRSRARNIALEQAHADGIEWVFFQDADDFIAPNAFAEFGRVLEEFPDISAAWGLICTLDDDGVPVLRDTQREVILSREELLTVSPYNSLQIGAFMKTGSVLTFGFDETMNCGEDFKIYYQMWKQYECVKVPVIFFINRRGHHSTGPRAATGQDWVHATNRLWAQELSSADTFATIECDGVTSKMLLTNPTDIIQQHYIEGQFFEQKDLLKLRSMMKKESPRIVEVGANIGNHVVFYANNMNASVIYPVEPNPVAINILERNIDKNGIGHLVDRRGIGFGVGRSEAMASIDNSPENNLGATSLKDDQAGTLPIVTLDKLIGQDEVDLLKIDAEGMELDVLAGATALIEKNRPLIWIEIMRRNEMEFLMHWLKQNDYRIVHAVHAVHAVDYFIEPKFKTQ